MLVKGSCIKGEIGTRSSLTLGKIVSSQTIWILCYQYNNSNNYNNYHYNNHNSKDYHNNNNNKDYHNNHNNKDYHNNYLTKTIILIIVINVFPILNYFIKPSLLPLSTKQPLVLNSSKKHYPVLI